MYQLDRLLQQDATPAATESVPPTSRTEDAGQSAKQSTPGAEEKESANDESASEEATEIPPVTEQYTQQDSEPLEVKLERMNFEDDIASPAEATPADDSREPAEDGPIYDDPSDEDDGEGEWITPSNVALHKSRALHLIPDEGVNGGKGKGRAAELIKVGCMTADFAMQNVLLQMGLSLVGVEGKKIDRVKTWVLRCHACFKYVSSSG